MLALVLLFCGAGQAQSRRHRRPTRFHAQATAYSQQGTTASGEQTRVGIVAADPAVLPMGTRIRVRGQGISGTYVVSDTGRKVGGRHIDIFMPSWIRAKRFGKKVVEVRVLKWGDTSPS